MNKITSYFISLKLLGSIVFLLIHSTAHAYTIEANVLKKWFSEPASYNFSASEVTNLKRFYSARNYQAVWVEAKSKPSSLAIALAFIADAETDGLDSRDYQLQRLQHLQSQLDNSGHFAVELELQTTHALLTLTRDLARGRLSASAADPHWHIPQPTFDTAAFLLKAINTNHLQQSLYGLAPKKPSYQLLKQTLARYLEIASAQAAWTQLPDVAIIRPHTVHHVIPLIRKRMHEAYIADGLDEYNIAQNSSKEFDAELVAAIKVFQTQHGLNADGLIGKNTLQALNTPLSWKIRQLRINMERLRWLPRDLGERYLLVNLAGFRLTAVDHGEHIFKMRIIVGRDYRATPSFNSYISHMTLNPYWNIPLSIAHKDLLPKQQQNPEFFTNTGIKVYANYNYEADALDPATIDWHKIEKEFPYILRQDPGENNALGTIKFMFPNPFDIYLHDTPSKLLFQKDIRTFSSGCIRLEAPLELAAFSLGIDSTTEKFNAELKSGETIKVNLSQRLPIYLVYITAWVDELNKVHFSPDTYGRDSRALGYADW